VTAPEIPQFLQPGLDDLDATYLPRLFRTGVLTPLYERPGVLDRDAGHLRVTQRGAGANLSVDVAAGRAAIRGTKVAGQGTYLCVSTAVENRTVTAPASGARTYRIVARVRDKADTTAASSPDTASDWSIESSFAAGSNPPPEPDSAITLATFTLTSSTTSVTTAMINDVRPRAGSGTAALTGTWGQTGINSTFYGADDPTRPLTWMKTPDGFVTLGGWMRRKGSSTTPIRNEFYTWDGTRGWGKGAAVLPPEIRPVGGVRDTVTITSNGDMHVVLFPSGVMSWRFQYDTTLVAGTQANQTWFAFDGITYRASDRF